MAFYFVFFIGLFCFDTTDTQAQTPDSLQTWRNSVVQNPKDGHAWTQLGYAYLNADSISEAENAFKKGVQYANSAEAYNGRGLVLMAKGIRHARNAFYYFRQALQKNPQYINAQLNIARTHIMFREPDAEVAFRKAMAIDSTYAPVYLELANWYLEHNYEVYSDKLADLYQRYIALRPKDEKGYYGLALTYTVQKSYPKVLDTALTVIRTIGINARWAALMAQAYAARGEHDKALALFDQYLQLIPPEERAFYDDIAPIAAPHEIEAYKHTSPENRDAFLKRFWQKRDPLLTGGVARQVEHHRRVWFARTFFAQKVTPYDRRGEIYIRYGEPDYRSRSNSPNALLPPAVDLVKQRIANQIYNYATDPEGEASEYVNLDGSPRFIWSWLEVRPDGQEYWRPPGDMALPAGGLKSEQYIGPLFPVARDVAGEIRVPWESWIYVHVGGGIEFVFNDLVMNGKWDFALPPAGILNTTLAVQVEQFNPAVILQQVAAETPDRFDIPPGIEPLEFYYDIAQFRGKTDKTNVEIYVGIPPEQVAIRNQQGQVTRSVVFATPDGEIVQQQDDPLTFAIADTSQLHKGAFAPNVTKLPTQPGAYQMAVRITDKNSGKWGVYVQNVSVTTFTDTLSMSDLALAHEITNIPRDPQFQKDDIWVIPMPSRHYQRHQSLFVYYEIYNLAQDEFGQTRYRVDYTIQQDMRKGTGLFGALSVGVHKLIASGKPQVVIGYERTGPKNWEPIYLEIDTKKVSAGLNQIAVTITDLVTGNTTTKQAMFQLSESPASQ